MAAEKKENSKKKRTFKKTCPGCGEVFIANRRDTIYCSKGCSQYVHRERNYLNKDQKDDRDKLLLAYKNIEWYKKERVNLNKEIFNLKREVERLQKENAILKVNESQLKYG